MSEANPHMTLLDRPFFHLVTVEYSTNLPDGKPFDGKANMEIDTEMGLIDRAMLSRIYSSVAERVSSDHNVPPETVKVLILNISMLGPQLRNEYLGTSMGVELQASDAETAVANQEDAPEPADAPVS